MEEMLISMEKAKEEGADLVEVHIDAMSFSNISEAGTLLKQRTMPTQMVLAISNEFNSVGIPHKEAAASCCDEVHPLAESIGAVNTILRRLIDGKLVGYNTDCESSITTIEDALRVRREMSKPG